MGIYIIKEILIVSILTIILFGIDKLAAKSNGQRLSEEFLIVICILGGAIGGSIGMLLFNHKTKKENFRKTIPVLALIYLLILLVLFLKINK